MRVGVVGCSPHHSRLNRIPALEDAGAIPVAVADPDAGRLAGAADDIVARGGAPPATYSTLEEMLAQEALDGVALVVPTPLHTPLTLLALEHGCHVLVEKPFATSLAAAETMLAAAAAADRHLVVGYQKHFGVPQALEVARSGRLGHVRFAHAAWKRPPDVMPEPPSFWSDPETGGATIDLASHLVNTALLALPGRPSAVTSHYSSAHGRERFGDAFRAEDSSRTLIAFDDGVALTVSVDWESYAADESARLDIEGTLGSLTIPLPGPEVEMEPLRPRLITAGSVEMLAAPLTNRAAHTAAARHFVAVCRGEAPPPSDAELLATQSVLDAMRRSAHNHGRQIELEPG